MLELAAACTIGASVDIDTDSEMRSLIFSHFRVSGLGIDGRRYRNPCHIQALRFITEVSWKGRNTRWFCFCCFENSSWSLAENITSLWWVTAAAPSAARPSPYLSRVLRLPMCRTPVSLGLAAFDQGTQNRGAADRSRTTGWGWSGGGSGAGPVDPGDYDTDEANASMAMLPAVPCRRVGKKIEHRISATSTRSPPTHER